ncbi:hypothetical protein XI07_13185 [Bradyrhizobium sp. CCBAU 11445]|uniref:hypothetical protein n=1 Tax=Bradyrhizobium sp. CCBAU 11445 TaxID=1630896 RepID=UPI002305EFF7|nr:hypothetical protein [Bradyrhizobium sp. CCBAU 11445]MDA9482964.1 hypothetical protein [Bradyrhizobium sp. CCBAU 11445]
MAERLGNVFYWIGIILAALAVVAGVTMAVIMVRTNNPTDVSAAPIVGAVMAASGLIPYFVGRACRYVLAGRF